jgi:chromosome segregation ATPase
MDEHSDFARHRKKFEELTDDLEAVKSQISDISDEIDRLKRLHDRSFRQYEDAAPRGRGDDAKEAANLLNNYKEQLVRARERHSDLQSRAADLKEQRQEAWIGMYSTLPAEHQKEVREELQRSASKLAG